MKLKMGISSLMVLASVWSGSGHAAVLASCESKESIAARADDEVCDYFVEAAEDCFNKLNRRLGLFLSRGAKSSTSELLSEAEPIRKTYEIAIPIVQPYSVGLDKGSCGNQLEELDVIVEALKEDLATVNGRIKSLKRK